MILNKILVGGRLSTEPELRVTANGTKIGTVNLAFNPPPRTVRGQRVEQPAVFVKLERWGANAEALVAKYHKGDSVMVEGALLSDSWQDKTTQTLRQTLHAKVHRIQRSGLTNLNYCRVIIAGNLTRDPQKQVIENPGHEPRTMAIVDIAFNDFPYEVNGELRNPDPVYVPAVCFDADAENTLKFAKRGHTVLLEGTLYPNTYTPKGATKEFTSIRMSISRGGIKFLKRAAANKDGADHTAEQEHSRDTSDRTPVGTSGENLDEDVPF